MTSCLFTCCQQTIQKPRATEWMPKLTLLVVVIDCFQLINNNCLKVVLCMITFIILTLYYLLSINTPFESLCSEDFIYERLLFCCNISEVKCAIELRVVIDRY